MLKLVELVRAFRGMGHFASTFDPLGLRASEPHFRKRAELLPIPDLDPSRPIPPNQALGFLGTEKTVGGLIEQLKRVYCGDIGFEFSYLTNPKEQRFFVERVERPGFLEHEESQRVGFFEAIASAVLFERQCARAFPTVKRFGLDGLESLVVALKVFCSEATAANCDSIVLAMAHRGRLNVSANVLNRPLEHLFAEFRGASCFPKSSGLLGDVKYHLGYFTDLGGLKLDLMFNPSHLEFVFPVALGKARARQTLLGDINGDRVVPVVVHGDAAVSGEGIVYETVQMAKTRAYGVGGTVHVVANNQIGFTAYPTEYSSSLYPTDIAKVIDAPAIHVNSYNVDAVASAAKLAFEFRQKFKKDIFINLVGFRRFGHNELDMPKFTNAEMYARVDKLESVMERYGGDLVGFGVSREVVEGVQARVQERMDRALRESVGAEIPELPRTPEW